MPTLQDLDSCTKLFKNSKELRNSFSEEIQEFKKNFETELMLWQYDHHGKTNNGKIYANYIAEADNELFIATIPIMYEGNELVPLSDAIEHIAYYLQIDENFERLFKEKSYLLKQSEGKIEYEYADEYFNKGKDNALKQEVINSLINRIKIMDEEKRYLYLRTLMNICHLTEKEIYTIVGKVGMINDNIPQNTAYSKKGYVQMEVLEDSNFERALHSIDSDEDFSYEVYDDAPDYFKDVFYKAIENNDFDILFNLFSSEEIDLYSNYYKKGKVK